MVLICKTRLHPLEFDLFASTEAQAGMGLKTLGGKF